MMKTTMRRIIRKLAPRKLTALALTLVLAVSLIPFGILLGDSGAAINPAFAGKAADTQDNTVRPNTLAQGQVWTGKNVVKDSSVLNNGEFGIELSALGKKYPVDASTQYDVVFVLDASGSMTTSRINAMIAASNSAFSSLLTGNTPEIFNRLAVVKYNTSASRITPSWVTDKNFTISSSSLGTLQNATNIESGLACAKDILATRGRTSIPVIILLTDGAPNRYYTNNFDAVTASVYGAAGSGSGGADGDAVSAAYTVAYANWLKKSNVIPNLKIYTVGFEISTNQLAKEVLNIVTPIPATSDILDNISTAMGKWPGGMTLTDYTYVETNGALDSNLANLGNLLPGITSGLGTGLPTAGDLVLTDKIGPYFDVEMSGSAVKFFLDGTDLTTIDNNTTTKVYKYTAANNVKVEFNLTAGTVTYTIPNTALKVVAADNNSFDYTLLTNYSSLKFNVILKNSAATADRYYFTDFADTINYPTNPLTPSNGGCDVTFAPAGTNPYYYTLAPQTWQNVGSQITKTYKYFTTLTSTISWNCQYDNPSNTNNDDFDSITIDGTTYNTPRAGSGGNFSSYNLSQSGTTWTVTFTPNGTGQPTYTFSFTASSGNNNTTSGSNATKTVTINAWRDTKNSSDTNDDTSITAPSFPGTFTGTQSVTINGETFTGTMTGTANNWTLTGSKSATTAGNIIDFTITRGGANGDTLSVVTQEKSPVPASYQPIPGTDMTSGIVARHITATGWIVLENGKANLTIRKTVNTFGNTSVTPVTPANGFEFTLNTGTTQANVSTFTGTCSLFDAGGNLLNSSYQISTGKFNLQAGQYVEVPLTIGTQYNVIETTNTTIIPEMAAYKTTYTNETGAVATTMNPVVVTNTYYPTATMDITKNIQTLYPSVQIPNVMFPFGLYTKNDQGAYIQIAGPSASVNTNSPTTTQYTAEMSVMIKTLDDMGLFGSGNSVTLYVAEGVMTGVSTGWTKDMTAYPVTIGKDGSVSYGQNNESASFTNKYVPTATLTLEKKLPAGGSNNKEFSFTVTLGTEGIDSDTFVYTIVENGVTPGTEGTADNGRDTITGITLKANQKIEISGIPVGTPYAITEGDYSTEGYITNLGTISGPSATGSILPDGSKVTVSNTYQTGTVIVTKTVTATERNDIFTFTVKMNGSQNAYTGFSYAYKNGDSFDTPTESTDGTFTLTSGQTVQLTDLPAGATYTITETENGAYTTTNGVNDPTAATAGSIASISALSPETSATPTVYFKNAYNVGSLSVTKQVLVDGDENNSLTTYPIKVTFDNTIDTDGFYEEITGMLNGTALSNDESGVFTFDLKKGQTAVFSNVPAGTTYTVEETNSKDADIVNLVYSDTGTPTVSKGDSDSADITNSYLTPANLTISKTVNSDKNLTYDGSTMFDYQIYFYIHHDAVPEIVVDDQTIPAKDAYDEPYVLDTVYELPNSTLSSSSAYASFAAVTDEDGYYTFSLGHEQKLVFDNLPVGVKFAVTELSDKGAKDSKADIISGAANASIATDNDLKVIGSIIQDTDASKAISIQYTNDFSVTPGKLTLVKSVVDTLGISNGTYAFTVKFTNQTTGISVTPTSGVTVPAGAVSGDTITYNVTMTGAQSVEFNGLLIGTKYEVTETTKDADTTTMNGAASYTTGELTMAAMVSDAFTVQPVTVTCVNTYIVPTIDTVKTVNGKDEVTVNKNTDVTYTIKVTNTSDRTLNLTKVDDPMYADLTADSNLTVVPSDTSKTLNFSVDTSGVTAAIIINGGSGIMLEPDDSITITYNLSFATSGEKENTAMAYAYYNGKEIKDSDTAVVIVNTSYAAAIDKVVADGGDGSGTIDYSILSYSDADSAAAALLVDHRDIAVYKVTFENTDNDPLTQLALNDALFSLATIVSVKLIGTDNSETTIYGKITGNEMTFYTSLTEGVGDAEDVYSGPVSLNGGQKIEVIYTTPATWVDAAKNNNYENTASLTAYDITAITETANVAIKTPTIDVSKTAIPLSVLIDKPVSYTITIDNTYDLPLDLLSVQDTFFAASSDYTVSNIVYKVGNGTPITVDMNDPLILNTTTGTLSFANATPANPSFGTDENVVITYTVVFSKAGSYANTAQATAHYEGLEAEDSDPSNNTVTVEVKDPTLGIIVDKLVNNEKSVSVLTGSTVTYTVAVTNTSDIALGHVTLKDPMYADAGVNITGIVLKDGSTTKTMVDGTDYEKLGETITISSSEPWLFFNPGATITVTYTYQVKANYTNHVEVTALTNREAPITDSSSADVTVYTPPVIVEYGALTVDKAVSGSNPSATEKFAFTVTFTPGTMNVLGITNSAGLTGTNGVYTFSLSADDTPVTFSNIPLGTTYTVSESLTADQGTSGWTAPAASTGAISATTSVTVTVNNVYDAGVEGTSDKPDDESGVAGATDVLPQTGGISASTLLGLLGLAMIAIGGTSITIFRRNNRGKSN